MPDNSVEREVAGEGVDSRAASVVKAVLPDGRTVACERYEALVPQDAFVVNKAVEEACLACPTYSKSHSCPPYSPSIGDYTRGLGRARVIFLRLPVSEFTGETPLKRATAASHAAMELLRRELFDALEHSEDDRIRIAGAGRCTGCERCSRELGGEACVKPEALLYSLESMGVNVVELVRDVFGISLEWSEDDVDVIMMGAVGAVFYD